MKPDPFEKRALKNLKEICSDPSSKTFLLAVSGGVDSMVLCHVFYNLNLKFEIAHCNFCLRGKESDADERLVKEIAFEMSVPFHCKRFEDLKANAKDNSIQKLARDLRYKWFDELIHENKLDHIIVAHHANDNFETALYHFVKGTGLKGLKGIPQINDKILRPLLTIEKSDILYYAKRNKIEYRDDKSNESIKYHRNLLRLEVIPQLQKINPDCINTFHKHRSLYTDAQDLIDTSTKSFKQTHTSLKREVLAIDFEALMKTPGRLNILLNILEEYGFTLDQINSIFREQTYQSGKSLLSKTHKLVFNRKELLVSPIQVADQNYSIDKIPSTLKTRFGEIIIEKLDSIDQIQKDINTVYLKADLKLPLEVRNWQAGDSFYPSGMDGKKQKLKDYYINNKYSLPEKQNQLLLISDGQICWIIGKRVDERFIEKAPIQAPIKVSWKSNVIIEDK